MSDEADDADYELKPAAPAPRRPAHPTASASPASSAPSAAPVPAANRVLPYASSPASHRTGDQLDTDTLKNFQLPLWLLIGGVTINVIAAFFTQPTFLAALASVGLELIVGTALMLIGVLITAKIRQINLGSFGSAVLKLAAVSVAPSAVAALFAPFIRWIPIVGGLAGSLASFVIFFALLGLFFDLDESDTWYCVCVMFLIGLGISFLALACGFK